MKDTGVDVGTSEPDINVSVILVGRPETVKKGPQPYIACAKRAMQHDVDAIYFLARGQRNVRVAAETCQSLVETDAVRETLRLRDRFEVNGRRKPSILICIEPSEGDLEQSG